MFKIDTNRYVNAGTNEIHRWGRKAQEKIKTHLMPNDNGFYTIPADGGRYWTIGTSNGKFGEYARFGDVYLSVNKSGNVWAKVGTPKADAFVKMVEGMLNSMIKAASSNVDDDESESI